VPGGGEAGEGEQVEVTLGFRATDDDSDDAPSEVRDGVASEREPGLREQSTVFLDLCRELREMGVSEVRAGDFRAVWPTQPSAAGLSVVRVPLTKPTEPKPPEPTYEAYEGERPTPETQRARADRERIRKLVGGET
jgi:hypothetical protein